MITRDILNSDSEVIGQISFPDGTSEEFISSKLADYSAGTSIHIPDVTPRQFRLALLYMGITDAMIVGAINTLSSPTKEAALIAWEYSTAFQRNNPFSPLVAAALGYNGAQLDQLWLSAGAL